MVLSLIEHNVDDLDLHVHCELANSLSKIGELFRKKKLPFEHSRLDFTIDRLYKGQSSPHIFSRYFDIVLNLELKNPSEALNILSEIFDEPLQAELNILPYSLASLGQDYYRYPKLVFSTFSDTSPIAQPSEDLFESHKRKVQNALEIIRSVDFASYDAFSSLVSEIVIGVGESEENSFGGASSLMIWGAIFINAERYREIPDIVEFIIHELTHCILFGINAKNRLVLNPSNELFFSSLRSDPRPMDGVYHAALVCASVSFFTHAWLLEKELTLDQVNSVQEIHARNKKSFKEILPVIKNEAKLSSEAFILLTKAEETLVNIET